MIELQPSDLWPLALCQMLGQGLGVSTSSPESFTANPEAAKEAIRKAPHSAGWHSIAGSLSLKNWPEWCQKWSKLAWFQECTLGKWRFWGPKVMEVWFRWLSFSNRWFSGSMFIFQGVQPTPQWENSTISFPPGVHLMNRFSSFVKAMLQLLSAFLLDGRFPFYNNNFQVGGESYVNS